MLFSLALAIARFLALLNSGIFLNVKPLIAHSKIGVADFMYEFFLKGAQSAPFKKNSYPD